MLDGCLLDVKNLKTTFVTENGPLTAVDNVSFSLKPGEILGVVGESGCGKSITARSILRLLNERRTRYGGEVLYKGRDLLKLSQKAMQKIRGQQIAMVFQNALTALNPAYTVGHQIAESITWHLRLNKKEALERAVELLRLIGIPAPEHRANQYPHQMSGGMRQRVMIAMALSCQPHLLIADEPTTALDVITQAQILELIAQLTRELGMGVIMITHDLGVVAKYCTRVVVMYLGQVVEEVEVSTLLDRPLHPYTQGLLACIPPIGSSRPPKLRVIKGNPPPMNSVPEGCRFSPRCPYVVQHCLSLPPRLKEIGPRHKVRCWLYEGSQEGEERC